MKLILSCIGDRKCSKNNFHLFITRIEQKSILNIEISIEETKANESL